MGYFIHGPDHGKGEYLVQNHGATRVHQNTAALSMGEKENAIICVVDNGPFEAAAYAYDRGEFERFSIEDGRKKAWYIMSRASANALTGYKDPS